MRDRELTPWILNSSMTPDLAGAKHGVNGPGQLASRGDASDPPIEARLHLIVVAVQPTLGCSASMDDDGLDERVPEPTVGPGGDGSVPGRHAGTRRARRKAGVTDQIGGGPEPCDLQDLGGEKEPTEGANAGHGAEQSHGSGLWTRVPSLLTIATTRYVA